jgi:hypothetical protein
VVSWLRVGPTTKPSHHEAIPANNYASPASAGLFNPQRFSRCGKRSNASARAGDFAGALAHCDHALRVFPSSGEALFANLGRGVYKPTIRAALAGYAAAPWFQAFFAGAFQRGADPHALSELLRAAGPRISEQGA